MAKSKRGEAEQAFPQNFHFEAVTSRIRGGGYFQPLKDATHRWVVQGRPSYSFMGPEFRILYRRRDDSYLIVDYFDCKSEGPRGNEIWFGELDEIRPIAPLDAAHFLLEHQFEIPDDLLAVMREFDETLEASRQIGPTVRPLSFWEENKPAGSCLRQKSHQVDLLESSESILLEFADFLQEVKNWSEGRQSSFHELTLFSMRLFACYEVDVNHWNAVHDEPPPASLDLLDLEWPNDLVDAREAIGNLRDVVLGPISCLAATYDFLGSDFHPTIEETTIAQQDLVEKLSDLREIYSQLNRAVRPLLQARKQKTRQPAKKSSSPDTPKAAVAPEIIEQEEVMTSEESVVPSLEFVPGGYIFNGKRHKLSGKPLELFKELAKAKDLTLTRRQAIDRVWNKAAIQDNTVNVTIGKVRDSLRKCLYLTDQPDPLPALDRGDQVSWKLEFRFTLKKS